MDIHQNARLTPHGRAELVRRVLVLGQARKAVATDLGVDVKTVNKWCERFQAEGELVRTSRAAASFDSRPTARRVAHPGIA